MYVFGLQKVMLCVAVQEPESLPYCRVRFSGAPPVFALSRASPPERLYVIVLAFAVMSAFVSASV